MRTDTPQAIFLKDYCPPAFLITSVSLNIDLDRTATRVRSVLEIRPNDNHDGSNAPLVLDGEDIELVSLKLNGSDLPRNAYTLGDRNLSVTTLPPGAFTLEIETKCDPSANTQLSGLYISNGVFCTQCEAEGFRRITYLLDRPDILAVYTVRIEANKKASPVLLSNGNLVESGDIPHTDRHFALWRDPHPKPSYLFALVGGDLGRVTDRFTTMSGRRVDLAIYVEHGKENRCGYALDSLKRAMRWDEEKFGREYDLDIFMIVAVSDFNMGAMENKGLNIFNDKFVLADAESATDVDFARIEAIIAHEYFHNWTGNRITCRDWFQLCLKEGLTVYRDQEFSADMRARAVTRIDDVRTLRTHQFPEDAGPLAHPVRPNSFVEINNFYTATVYEKGAELVRMIATIVGPDDFRAGMDLYFERFDGTAATVDDFLDCFQQAANVDLAQFGLWYSQAGTPEISYTIDHDADAGVATLDFSQHLGPTPGQTEKRAMHIPLRLALLAPDGKHYPLHPDRPGRKNMIAGDVLHLKTDKTRIRFANIPNRPVLSLGREFSAPVRIVSQPDDETLLFLMRHDDDAFNRWEAAQTCALRILETGYRGGGAAKPDISLNDFAAALDEIVANDKLEPAYRAEFLKVPSQTEIAAALQNNIDPELIRQTQTDFRNMLALKLQYTLTRLLDTKAGTKTYSPDARSAGTRALRNGALALLCVPGDRQAATRANNHLASADNMTDTMAALTALTHMKRREADFQLDVFYERFRNDPLVVDKWFTLHAISARPDTLERIGKLLAHSAFSWRNPNRIRSLIGALATLNPAAFHRADGAGYRMVIDSVIKLDAINPQVAARLLGVFRSWKMLEPGRQELAKSSLQSLADRTDLSSDVGEIVGKSLSAET
ncbi:MAG: aminopeptidase N [Fimbriimonadaceae bacterium]|nr:aminopeptidase N [Alphaproteobacteria bacterium]